MKKEFTITFEQGLHARPATLLVNKANEFECDVLLPYKETTVDFKSIMGVLSLGVSKGSEISVTTSGIDEEAALNGIGKMITDLKIK